MGITVANTLSPEMPVPTIVRSDALHTRPILLVDDSEDCRIIYSVALRHAGLNVITAATAEDGIDAASRHRPGLVLLDLVLPDMNGVEALPQFRRIAGSERVPIVALTGRALVQDVAELRTSGFDDVLLKPLIPSALVTAVRSYLAGDDSHTGG